MHSHPSVTHPYAPICLHVFLIRTKMQIFNTHVRQNANKNKNIQHRTIRIAIRSIKSFRIQPNIANRLNTRKKEITHLIWFELGLIIIAFCHIAYCRCRRRGPGWRGGGRGEILSWIIFQIQREMGMRENLPKPRFD